MRLREEFGTKNTNQKKDTRFHACKHVILGIDKDQFVQGFTDSDCPPRTVFYSGAALNRAAVGIRITVRLTRRAVSVKFVVVSPVDVLLIEFKRARVGITVVV